MAVDQVAEYRELSAALKAGAADLLPTPVTLARGLNDKYVVRPYARIIGQAMADLLAGDTFKRLMIVLPTQVGKSTLVNEWGSFWWLAHRPEARIISTSYGDDLARSRGAKVRDLITEHGHLYDLHHTQPHPATHDWTLRTGGGMRSVAMGRPVTGFRADLLVIDDPFKDRQDAESYARREAVWNWYSSTGSQRLQPDSPLIVINTRWHHDDLSGRLLARDGTWETGGKWKVLHFPAIADPKFGPDPMGRQPGELLPHHGIKLREVVKLSRYWADKRSEQTVRDWEAMAQGDPRPVAGALVTYELLRNIREADAEKYAQPVKHAVAIDPSGGGRDSAGIVGGYLGDDGRLWVTHDRSGHGGSDEWSIWACELAAEIGADSFVVERNFGGDMAAQMLMLSWEKLGRDWQDEQAELVIAAAADGRSYTPPPSPYPMSGVPRLVEVIAKKGKVLRAELVAQQMTMDKVRLASAPPAGAHVELEQEWATWMPTDPLSPGRIDASVYLAWALLKIHGASRVISVAAHKKDAAGGARGIAARRIQR